MAKRRIREADLSEHDRKELALARRFVTVAQRARARGGRDERELYAAVYGNDALAAALKAALDEVHDNAEKRGG